MARTVGSKNTKYRGIPIDLYRRKRAELSKEEFDSWLAKKSGKPVIDVATVSSMIAELESLKKEVSWYSQQLSVAREKLYRLEGRSWIQRLFNLKG